MSAEIIVACRYETPRNLRRTLENIRRTMRKDDHITVVLDGPHPLIYSGGYSYIAPFSEPRGPGQCRDYAIGNSTADIVVLVDGHMTFPAGWLDTICAHIEKHPKDVTCCRMRGLGQEWEPLAEPIYHGCYLTLRHPHPSMKNWWICSRWNSGPPMERGVTGGIMGACYGLRRDWYEAMGRPLAILEAWGGDEESLSVCSWLMGGRCYLLPPVCGHIWAAKRDRPEPDYRENWRMRGNHYALLEALPVPEPEKTELRRHLDKGNDRSNLVNSWLEPRRDAIERLKEALNNRKHEWDWLKKKRIIRNEEK